MFVVLDANILFKALIGRGNILKLFFLDEIDLLAPEFLFEEFEKHKYEIVEKGKVSVSELKSALSILEERIKLVLAEEIPLSLKHKAKILSPHEKDNAYFEVALRFNAAILSDDKGFKKQSEIKIFTTEELFNLLNE